MRHARATCIVGFLAIAATACASGPTTSAIERPTVRILLVGDLSLGRGIAPVAGGDPEGLFRDVRLIVRDADLALANLESPLTTAPPTTSNPYRLAADPSSVALVASAGFDIVNLANNHVEDSGPTGVIDTVEAANSAGLKVVGVRSPSATHVLVDAHGLRIAVLGVDLGPDDGGGSSMVQHWDPDVIRRQVEEAAARSDIVVVSIHGGVEYLPEPDPRVIEVSERLVAWGADVVWGHGPHVPYPVDLVPSGDRFAVVAPSLGNFLFDQREGATARGSVLEVLVDARGVAAARVGTASHADLRVHFDGWERPTRDAVYLAGSWWALTRDPGWQPSDAAALGWFPWGDVTASDRGHITSQDLEVVVAFRKPYESHPIRDAHRETIAVDASGRTSHLGIYAAGTMTPIWVASVTPGPVGAVAACDRSVALAYTDPDDQKVVFTGAALWRPHGLDATELLDGPGTPGCFDVDADGLRDPVIVRR